MKILVLFVSFFFILVVGGSFSYVFLLWRQYWLRVGKLAREKHPIYPMDKHAIAHLNFDPVTSKFLLHRGPVRTTTTTPPPIRNDTQIWKELVAKHEADIRGQLRRTLMDTGKSVDSGKVINLYRVNFTGVKSMYVSPKMSPSQLVCNAMNTIELDTFKKGDAFFKDQKMDQYLMTEDILQDKTFSSCAVVPSAGSLLHSKLGSSIDANEFVIRFNHAPTKGFEKDVGKKTSLRIVNSQVVGKPEFRFLDSPLYSGDTLVWDPSRYGDTLKEWFAHPDYPFFESFFSKRLMKAEENLHLFKPKSLWSIWNWMQTNSRHSILPNPPSSGFLGVLLAIKHCRTVKVYEFIPSLRITKRCHYWDSKVEEENFGCTIGDWHPLAAEKLLTLAFNSASRDQVFGNGVVKIRGYPDLTC